MARPTRTTSSAKPPPTPTTAIAPKAGPPAAASMYKALGGTDQIDFNRMVIRQALASYPASTAAQAGDPTGDAMLAGMIALAPRDAVEGMMAAQMLGLHNAAMECLRRGAIDGQTFEGREMNLNQATKLSRAYAALVEGLGRHRGGGTHKIIVERVTVNAGGQAIVGNVGHTREGVSEKSEEQPHAKQLAYAPVTALHGRDTPREPLSVTRDDQRSLPHARRTRDRRA